MGGEGVSAFQEKKCYGGVRFNVISVTRGWVGVKFAGKKRFVTLEWTLNCTYQDGIVWITRCTIATCLTCLHFNNIND